MEKQGACKLRAASELMTRVTLKTNTEHVSGVREKGTRKRKGMG